MMLVYFFFFNVTATPEIYTYWHTLSLLDAFPISWPGQTLAIAQFFDGDADRDGRRNGRPFETVTRVAADKFDGSRGFRLRIAGRIEAIDGNAPIRCIQPAGAEQGPNCVIGARIDPVRLEKSTIEEGLATWTIRRTGQ